MLYFLCFLSGFFLSAFLTYLGSFLISLWALTYKASTDLTLAAVKHLAHLENYLSKSSLDSSFN